MSAALALAPAQTQRRRPTQRDQLDRLARHDHVFGRHSPLTRLGQAFARLLADWADHGEVSAYAWQLCEGLGRSGGKLRYSRRSWFRARLELLNNGCITEQLPERQPDGRYGAPPTFTLHFGPGARRLPLLPVRRLRAVVDQTTGIAEDAASDSNRVPRRHGSESLDPFSSQEITEPPSHPPATSPPEVPPLATPLAAPPPPSGTGETIGTPSPKATADLNSPPLTPPLRGGEESATRTVLHAACRIVMQAPASPRRERLRSPRRVRGELQRLAQAILARGASLDLVIHAARQYAAEDGPWCYWRNLAPGITQICDDVKAWAPLPQPPSPNGPRSGPVSFAGVLGHIAASASSSTAPPIIAPKHPASEAQEAPVNRPAASSTTFPAAPASLPAAPPQAVPRTAKQWAARLSAQTPLPEPACPIGDALPDWLRAFRDVGPSLSKKPDRS